MIDKSDSVSDFANYITELDSSVLLPLSILSVNPLVPEGLPLTS